MSTWVSRDFAGITRALNGIGKSLESISKSLATIARDLEEPETEAAEEVRDPAWERAYNEDPSVIIEWSKYVHAGEFWPDGELLNLDRSDRRSIEAFQRMRQEYADANHNAGRYTW